MLPRNWDEELARAMGVFYNGAGIGKDWRGRITHDVNFLLYFNSSDHPVEFTLPGKEYSGQRGPVLDAAGQRAGASILDAGTRIDVPEKSLLVLRAYVPPAEEPDHSVAASLALLRACPNPEGRGLR